MRLHGRSLLLFVTALVLPALPVAAQPFVKITSPPNGTVVHPGERIEVTVDATPFAFRAVMLPGWTLDAALVGPPYHLTIVVPTQTSYPPSPTPSGRFPLGAIGVFADAAERKKSNKPGIEAQIELDIERVPSPRRLKLFTESVHFFNGHFSRIEERKSIYVLGDFPDGENVYLSASTLTTFESSDPSIVAVDKTGVATAIASGIATITVKNRDVKLAIRAVVPNTR